MATGSRGPLKGATRRLPGVAATTPVLASFGPVEGQNGPETGRKPLPAPPNLTPSGRKVWKKVTAHMPLLSPELDVLAIERLVRTLEEREVVLDAWRQHGPLLDEVIVSPRGEVVGVKKVPNPASAMLRALDRQLDELSDRLALTPASRARLGLTMTTAEAFSATADAILSSKWRT